MTAPVTISEDLRTLLGIVQDTRDDLPDAGLPMSLLAELTDQIRCDNLSLMDADVPEEDPPGSWMQEIPPIDVSGIDEMATEGSQLAASSAGIPLQRRPAQRHETLGLLLGPAMAQHHRLHRRLPARRDR